MVNFTDTNITPIQGETRATASVPASQGPLIQAQAISGGIQSVLGFGAGLLDKYKKEEVQKAVTSFQNEQLALADAVDQGTISSQEARMRMRANYQRASSSMPSLSGDFLKVQQNIVTTSGLGKVVAEGTAEEQAKQKIRDDAYQNGFIPESAVGTEREDQFVQNYLSFKRDGELLARSTAEIQNATAQLSQQGQITSNKTALLNLEIKQKQVQATRALDSMSGTYFNKMSTNFNDLRSKLDAGQITPEEAILSANSEFAVVQSVVNQIGSGAGSELISGTVAPIQSLKDTFVQYANGTINKTVYENSVDAALAKTKLNILSDPKSKQLVATSQLFGNALPIIDQMSSDVLKILNQGQNGPVQTTSNDKSQQKDIGVALDTIKSNIKAMSSGQVVGDKELQSKEVDTQVGNILSGINAYSSATKNPSEYNQVVSFLASPEFGKYMVESGGLQSDVASNARDILRQQYEQEVLPLVKREYMDAQSMTGIRSVGSGMTATVENVFTPNNQLIEPKFSGSGITFVAKEGAKRGGAAEGFDVNASVRRLNKEVAPVVNRLIRMSSHLSGDTNYRKMWEDNYMQLFMPQEQAATDKPSESK